MARGNRGPKRRLISAAGLALIVSILGLILQWNENRRRGRDEVGQAPLLALDSRMGAVEPGKLNGLILSNGGKATATIKTMEIAVDGKIEALRTSKQDWESVLVKVGLPDKAVGFEWFGADAPLAAGAERGLLTARPEDLKGIEARFRDALKRLSVRICYCDPAGDHCKVVTTEGAKFDQPLPCPGD